MPRKIAVVLACATLACAPDASRTDTRADSAASVPRQDSRGAIVFLGTSLTAGYGVGVQNSYPSVIQQKLDSAGLPFRVINSGLSGETSAGGLRRLDWSLQQPIDVLVLELGANDGLRGLSAHELHANLDSIMTRTLRKYPDARIVLAGMQAPPNLGPVYTQQFRDVFRDLAAKHDAVLVPFLLEGVAADAQYNQQDGIHPNVLGHRMVANTVWQSLRPLLDSIRRPEAPAPRE